MVPAVRCLRPLHRLRLLVCRQLPVHPQAEQRHLLPSTVRRRHRHHGFVNYVPAASEPRASRRVRHEGSRRPALLPRHAGHTHPSRLLPVPTGVHRRCSGPPRHEALQGRVYAGRHAWQVAGRRRTTGGPIGEYRSLVGELQYLTMTRPDLACPVQQACLHMHNPQDEHLALVKRILRYVRGTTTLGFQLLASPSTEVIAYSDADWAGCPDTRRSTSGYCVYIGDSLISWSSKRQPTVSRSSAEAEYRAVANAVAECCWLKQLLGELDCVFLKATVVYCDNVSAVYMSAPSPDKTHRARHSFCKREGCARCSSSSTRTNRSAIR